MQPVTIAGGSDTSLADFLDRFKAKVVANIDDDASGSPADSSTLSSAPRTPGGGSVDPETQGQQTVIETGTPAADQAA